MKEQLISFDTAKLAKERGYEVVNYPFNYFYKGDKNSNYIVLSPKDSNNLDWKEVVLRPTQSLLQTFLRKRYKIIVLVDWNTSYGFYFKIVNYVAGVDFKDKLFFPIYEEALERGLQEALKLIK
jgi:hypothetical protein